MRDLSILSILMSYEFCVFMTFQDETVWGFENWFGGFKNPKFDSFKIRQMKIWSK
jgi:hypothetical protein